MIKIPEQQIVSKIKEKTGISDEDLEKKVQVKMDQLAGLISREGALHIIANEYNIKLLEETTGKLSIKNILTGMRNVEIVGKAVDVYEAREFNTNNRSGKVGSFILGDETGTVRTVLWGSQADLLVDMKKGDIIKVQAGYVKDNQGRQEVHLGDKGSLKINPEGENVGEVKRKSFTRKGIGKLQGDENDIEILATIVQAYNPTFFEVCPECYKRVRDEGSGFTCKEHGIVTPVYSYVLNAFLDDGTGNIRGVFFKNQANILVGKNEEEFLQYKESPEKFDEAKHELLGKMVKIVGRSKKNTMFDRMEFTAQLVFPNPDPGIELKRLKGEPYEQEEVSIKQSNDLYSESKKEAEEDTTEEQGEYPEKPAEETAKKAPPPGEEEEGPKAEVEEKTEEPKSEGMPEPKAEGMQEEPQEEHEKKEDTQDTVHDENKAVEDTESKEEDISEEKTTTDDKPGSEDIESREEELNKEDNDNKGENLVDEDILKIDDIKPVDSSTPGTEDKHL